MKKRHLIFSLVVCTIVVACSSKQQQDCSTANVTYSNTISSILNNNSCTGCHNNTSSSGGIELDNYNSVKAAAQSGKLFGAVNHSPGFSPMPQGGAKISQCDISRIKAWIDNGMPQN